MKVQDININKILIKMKIIQNLLNKYKNTHFYSLAF